MVRSDSERLVKFFVRDEVPLQGLSQAYDGIVRENAGSTLVFERTDTTIFQIRVIAIR